MRSRAALISIATIVALLLSGCAAEDAATTSARAKKAAANAASAGVDTELEKLVKLPIQRPGTGDLSVWYATLMNTSAEGGIAAYEWTVPEGAALASRFSQTSKYVYMEIAPIVVGEQPTRWGLFVFRVVEGKAVLAGSTTRASSESTFLSINPSNVPPTPRTYASTANVGPSMFSFGGPALEPGERVFFVLAAATNETGQFGLMMKVRDEAPGFETTPPEDLQAFIESVKGFTGRELNKIGQGNGLHIASFNDFNVFRAQGAYAYSTMTQTGAVKVTSNLPAESRVGVSARDQTISSENGVTGGWTMGSAVYFGDDAGGTWSASLDMHGVSRSYKGLVVQSSTPASIATSMIAGFPSYSFIADGLGKSRSEFKVTALNRNDFEILSYSHLTLGQSLKDLIGQEPLVRVSAGLGPAGNVPPTLMTFEHGDLVTHSPDGTVQRVQVGLHPFAASAAPQSA